MHAHQWVEQGTMQGHSLNVTAQTHTFRVYKDSQRFTESFKEVTEEGH